MAKRAYDILRSHVNNELDRIRGLEREEAQRELQSSEVEPRFPDFKRTPPPPLPPEHARKSACRILGVQETDEFDLIRKRFEELNQRSEPANFPEKSTERERAAALQVRIHWAYTQLTEDVDVSERRFKSLDIE